LTGFADGDLAAIQSEFDRLAAVEELETFSNTEVYLPWLVGRLPRRVARMAEVGCGGGALTQRLAPIADELLAIDLSGAMLALARTKCARWPHVSLRQCDANDWDPEPRSLDAIVSVATLHHLDAARVLPRWAAALRPGGTLLILEVLRRPGLSQLPLNGLAFASSRWLRWQRTGRWREDPRVRDAWAAHARFDRLSTLNEVRAMVSGHLPGARVRHHVLWRYSIQYRAPAARKMTPHADRDHAGTPRHG
jgi:SAM-dependent methyltransferase